MSHDEHKKIIDIAVNECKGKIPVIAGTGSNSTSEAVELSKYAEMVGSDALFVTPYYNKPTQEVYINIIKKLMTMLEYLLSFITFPQDQLLICPLKQWLDYMN